MIKEIVKKRNVYIVPFIFKNNNKSFNEIVLDIKKEGIFKIYDKIKYETDLYDNILDCFRMSDNDTNVGCIFRYHKSFKESFVYTRFKNDIKVRFKNIGLNLFRTNVGFIFYEIDIDANNLDEYISFQNEFKELSYNRFANRKEGERYLFEMNDGYLLMGKYLKDNFISKLPFEVSYFAKRKFNNEYIADKALLFNYVVFKDIDKEKLYDSIFQINNGYNYRYKRKENFKDELLESFKDSYYYANDSGAGIYALVCEDNEDYYSKKLYRKVMVDYFKLYMLTLYQSYSILKFTMDMENKLPANRSAYLNENSNNLKVLKDLETDISIFLIKSIYSSVSHISHQNDFYHYLIKKLNVRGDIEDLTIGLDSLYKFEEEKEKERLERIKEEENKKREKIGTRFNLALALISFFAILSVVPDANETAKILNEVFGFDYYICLNIVFIGVIIVLILIFIIFGSGLFPFLNLKNKNKC